MAAASSSSVGMNKNGKKSGRIESWQGKCVKKWNLKLAPDDDTSETEWKKYYVERKAFEGHLEEVQDDPDEMAGEIFEGDILDCAETNDYLKILKDWRESVDKFGMTDLSNHLYPLKYSIELDGNNEPQDIHFRSRLYSPCSSNSVDLDFSFHYRPRIHTVEDYHILRIHLRSAEDISSKGSENLDIEDHFSKKWMTFLESKYVEKGHRRSRREYVDRKIVAVPKLLQIQRHLFGGGIINSENDRPEQAPKAKTCVGKKRKKDQKASSSTNGKFPQGPRDVCNIVLAATGFDLLDEEEYPDTVEWIKNVISGSFPQQYPDGKKPKASGRMYITERVDMYSGEDDESFQRDDDEFDEDDEDEFGERDMLGCRSM